MLDGALNGDIFGAYVGQILAPTLSPGDIVVLDNLLCHKVAGVQEAIESRGAQLLYLPPYSPDLNPIEQAFAKLKALLRKSAPAMASGMPSPKSSGSSALTSAATSFEAQDIQPDRALL